MSQLYQAGYIFIFLLSVFACSKNKKTMSSDLNKYTSGMVSETEVRKSKIKAVVENEQAEGEQETQNNDLDTKVDQKEKTESETEAPDPKPAKEDVKPQDQVQASTSDLAANPAESPSVTGAETVVQTPPIQKNEKLDAAEVQPEKPKLDPVDSEKKRTPQKKSKGSRKKDSKSKSRVDASKEKSTDQPKRDQVSSGQATQKDQPPLERPSSGQAYAAFSSSNPANILISSQLWTDVTPFKISFQGSNLAFSKAVFSDVAAFIGEKKQPVAMFKLLGANGAEISSLAFNVFNQADQKYYFLSIGSATAIDLKISTLKDLAVLHGQLKIQLDESKSNLPASVLLALKAQSVFALADIYTLQLGTKEVKINALLTREIAVQHFISQPADFQHTKKSALAIGQTQFESPFIIENGVDLIDVSTDSKNDENSKKLAENQSLQWVVRSEKFYSVLQGKPYVNVVLKTAHTQAKAIQLVQ